MSNVRTFEKTDSQFHNLTMVRNGGMTGNGSRIALSESVDGQLLGITVCFTVDGQDTDSAYYIMGERERDKLLAWLLANRDARDAVEARCSVCGELASSPVGCKVCVSAFAGLEA